MTDPETTPISSDIKGYLATFWGYLDKPAEWLAAALAWSPKLSLLIIIALALFAVF